MYSISHQSLIKLLGIFLLIIAFSCDKNKFVTNKSLELNKKKIDSIQSVFKKIKEPTEKLLLIDSISNSWLIKENIFLSLEVKFQKANALYEDNQYTTALNLYREIKEEAVKLNDKKLEARCLERMASVHLSTDNPPLSLKYYYESLAIFEEINDPVGIAKIYNILAIYKGEYKDFDTAFKYINRSLQIHDSLKDQEQLIQNKGNLAYIYLLKKEYPKSDDLYQKLIYELEKENEKLNLPMIYYSHAKVLDAMQKPEKAIIGIHKAIKISEETRDTSMLSYLYNDLGNRYKNNDSYQYWQKALICAKSIENDELEIAALESMLQMDIAKNDLREGVEKQKQILLAKERLQSKKISNHVKVSELKYLELKQKNAIEVQKNNLKKHRETIVWLSIISILGFIIAYVISKNRKINIINLEQQNRLKENEIKIQQEQLAQHVINEENQNYLKKQQELTIKLKENELSGLALQINFIEDFLSEINEVINSNTNPTETKIVKISNMIHKKQKDFNYPELFNTKFNQLHPDFLTNIQQKFPSLTKYELKLCAYIKMHLSNKQIAVIMNVNPDSINKSRYRLRKKLNVDKTETLEQYFEKQF